MPSAMSDNLVEILLVEDNPFDLELTLNALARHNLSNHVAIVRDGEEAQELVYGLSPRCTDHRPGKIMSPADIAAVLVDRPAGLPRVRSLDGPAPRTARRDTFNLLSVGAKPASASPNGQFVGPFKSVSRGASAAVMLGGCLVLVGWIFDIPILTTPRPEWVTVKANTALGFVLAGMALWLLQREEAGQWTRRIAHVGALTVALLGLLTLSEYLIGWDPGIDQLLVKELPDGIAGSNPPGRMAAMTALYFLLVGCALLLDAETNRGRQAAQYFGFTVGVFSLVALCGYLYGVKLFDLTSSFGSVALYTAFLFATLTIGILLAHPDWGLMAVISSDTAGGVMARRLLPIVIALPIGLGGLLLVGQRAGLFDTEFGLSLMVVSSIVSLVSIVWWNARALFRVDVVRQQAEEVRHKICDLGVLLSRSLRVEEIYPAFAEAIKTILPYERLGVIVAEGESLVMVLSVAHPPLASWEKGVFPSHGTAVEWVMAHKTARVVKDLAVEQVFADDIFIAQEGIRSTLTLPLLVGGEVVGVLVVDSRTPGDYGEAHVELLSLVTEPLALSLLNSRLFAQISRHANEMEQQVETRTRELRLANGELAQASRHKSEFLAHMSHELRTPLNAIIGFSDLLQDPTFGSLNEKQARYLGHIYGSGKHLLALINDLLDLSKIEAGRLELRPEPFVLYEALAAALEGVRPMADQKRLTVMLQTNTEPITLTADPVRFKQIMYNLLSNAIKFTQEDGRVTVMARVVPRLEPNPQPLTPNLTKSPEFVEISVTDTGIGLTTEDISKLFQRFTQLESTVIKPSEGTGLGLALTKQLVELHDGRIWATSEGKGRGSSFTVCLPLTPQAKQDMAVITCYRPSS